MGIAYLERVQAFCTWAEGSEHTLLEARQHLVALMQGIPEILSYRVYALDDEFDDPERRGFEGWKIDHGRFSDLPFQFYACSFDPIDLDGDSVVTGDLFDDLADVYGELYVGLQASLIGTPDAGLAMIVNSYFDHWGQHASQALNAIDAHYRKENKA